MKANRQFNLDKGENFRELGAYKTQDQTMTKERVYIRAGSTSNLSRDDLDFLKNYGVNLEIDLRSQTEVEDQPSLLKNLPGLNYVHLPMLDGLASLKEEDILPSSMYEVYVSLLEKGKNDYKTIFKLFLENEGVSLFHCSAGKDRTGVLAYLILGLAQVDRETILEDYEVSQENLENFINKQSKEFEIKTGKSIPKHFLESKRIDLEKTMDYLDNKYTNVRSYLKECGLTEDELTGLNEKFIKTIFE